jgi:hypothetical protein
MAYRVLLLAFLAVLFGTSCTSSDDEYLDLERFDLPVDGKAVRTTKPLSPYIRYYIRLASPVDLRPFRTVTYRWFRPNDVYWRFMLDGIERLASRSEEGPNGLINHVILEVQGTGKPLRIRTIKDFTADFDTPNLSVLVTRSRWWRQEDGTGVKPALFLLAIPLLIVVIIVCAVLRELGDRPVQPTLPVPISPQPPAPPVPVTKPARMLPAPAHHQRFTLKPGTPRKSPDPLPEGVRLTVTIEGLWTASEIGAKGVYDLDPTLYGIDAQYAGPCAKPVGAWQPHRALFFDDAHESASAFRHDRHHHRFSFAYSGTGDKLVLFLEVPTAGTTHKFWHHDTMSVTVREMTAAERAEFDAPRPTVPSRNHEEEKHQSYLDRIRALKIEYDSRPYLNEDQWLEQYTKKHLDDLLKDRARITKAHRELHTDPDFVRHFTKTEPELYSRVTWEYRALCRAEELEPGNTAKRPKLTPEERQAKFERYRARALERDRIQAEDRMAAVRQKLGLLQQFRDDLDTYDLDEDERDRLIKEFEDDLFAQPEENFDGTFKQL